MDPRLYTYERRTPRLNNPTFKSQFVTDSLLIFKGGPLGSSSLKKDYPNYLDSSSSVEKQSLPYNPAQISKLRASFQYNRSKVPLSNLSSYGREVMFPLQKQTKTSDSSNLNQYKSTNPQVMIKPQLYLDNKERNYIKTILKMNDQFLSRSRINSNIEQNKVFAGKPSLLYNDKDKRYYRYRHSYEEEMLKNKAESTRPHSLHKSFVPSRLNYADQFKGIL